MNGGRTTTSTAVELRCGQAEGDLLDQRDRLEMVEIHLPVAGDQRAGRIRHRSDPVEDGNARAASCPPGTPAMRRRRSRCGRTLRRRGRAPERPPPSHRRRRRSTPSRPRPPRRRPWCPPRTAPPRTRPSARSRTPSGRRPGPRRTRPPPPGRCPGPWCPAGIASAATTWVCASSDRSAATTMSVRQHDLAGGLGEQRPAGLDLVVLEQRVADLVALGLEEGEAHPAADQQPSRPWAAASRSPPACRSPCCRRAPPRRAASDSPVSCCSTPSSSRTRSPQ